MLIRPRLVTFCSRRTIRRVTNYVRQRVSTSSKSDESMRGVTTLFAALNMLTGQVLSMTDQLHRHQEWLRFLKLIERHTPKGKQLHLIIDNYATHKHPEVKTWLDKHRRFHLHFTPTSSSWLNMVERFFRDITDQRIRRGVFTSVPELEAAINEYIAAHNAKPKP
ncbi:MAG TPA: IS630 family transposase, partial [Casimicrobiaceae bacterium]|nr:IS630 family transposase [Casimicrobiaceae bacterium]